MEERLFLRFVGQANLPDSPVTHMLIDGRLCKKFFKVLSGLGVSPIPVDMHPGLQEAVAGHADMSFCHLGGKDLVYAPGVKKETISLLSKLGFHTIEGKTVLKPEYPSDIAYNVAIVGEFAFHDFRHTDETLKELLLKKGVKMINVKQGYSKCSVCVLRRERIITTDAGIADAAERVGISTLYIGPQHSILLPGLDYGFIGGATGLLDRDILAFTGSIERLSSRNEIRKFMEKSGVVSICLTNDEMLDAGSLLPIMCL
jgi:hypothetical protein